MIKYNIRYATKQPKHNYYTRTVNKMKKVLSVFFAMLFALSALSVCSYAAEAKFSEECPYCHETFDTETEYVAHMKSVAFPGEGHSKTCPYTGSDYEDGGCGKTFTTKEGYDYHIANCPYKDKPSSTATLKKVGTGLFDALKSADWGGLFNSIISIVKSLIKAIPFGDILSAVKGLFSKATA